MAKFYVAIGCVRFARYCGKMYGRHLYPYRGLGLKLGTVANDDGCTLYNDNTVGNVIIYKHILFLPIWHPSPRFYF